MTGPIEKAREAGAPPALRIVRGDPSDTEVAVLAAVVTAVAAGSDDAPAPFVPRGRWNDPASAHRRPLLPGPGAWHGSRMR
ncbi:MAG: acyl-CoA carboxylase subunit epsilon [Actinomycetota bacterium]|nr:acyl-CoA carboxylase subunit epsilon [Actinomycetota bacterium]